jgi:hypothetical protein
MTRHSSQPGRRCFIKISVAGLAVCGNCSLYSGKPGAADGPCSVFGGKLVSAKGWCTAWVKKA